MVVHRSVSKTVRVLNGSSFFHRDLGCSSAEKNCIVQFL